MKKRILLLLATVVVLAALCLPLTASADAAAMEVTVGSLSAKQGDEIVVPVTINKNPGIWGFNWNVYYDSQVLRFDSIEFSKEGEFAQLDFLDTNTVKYPIVINASNSTSTTENVTTTGVVAKIHFKVFVGAKLGETKLELRLTDPGNNINVASDSVPLNIHNGAVTVTKGLTSSSNSNDYPPKEPLKEAARPHVAADEVPDDETCDDETWDDETWDDETWDDETCDDETWDDEISLEEIQETRLKRPSNRSNSSRETQRTRGVKEDDSPDDNTVLWIVIGILGVSVISLSIVIVCITARRNKW